MFNDSVHQELLYLTFIAITQRRCIMFFQYSGHQLMPSYKEFLNILYWWWYSAPPHQKKKSKQTKTQHNASFIRGSCYHSSDWKCVTHVISWRLQHIKRTPISASCSHLLWSETVTTDMIQKPFFKHHIPSLLQILNYPLISQQAWVHFRPCSLQVSMHGKTQAYSLGLCTICKVKHFALQIGFSQWCAKSFLAVIFSFIMFF